jgi:hypothetical protein
VRINPSDAGVLRANFTIDTGADPRQPAPARQPNGSATGNTHTTVSFGCAHERVFVLRAGVVPSSSVLAVSATRLRTAGQSKT